LRWRARPPSSAAFTPRNIRNEGDSILAALDEAFRIGREAGIPVEIWHLKAAGKANWGRMAEIVAHIEQARRSGVDVAADTYAYPAWFKHVFRGHPPWLTTEATRSWSSA